MNLKNTTYSDENRNKIKPIFYLRDINGGKQWIES